MLYPQYFIDDLKNRPDIVRVIRRSVKLKKNAWNGIANWFVCVLSLVLVSVTVFPQDKPQAIQTDELGEATCEDLEIRLQNLYAKLAEMPGARAVVVIHPGQNGNNAAVAYSKRIDAQLRFYKLDRGRLDIVAGQKLDRFEIHIWLVPSGAMDPPNMGPVASSETYDLSKPFIYGTSSFDEDCPTFVAELYADLIKANPSIRGHIVIFPYTGVSKQQMAADWIKVLTEDFGVPRDRLRIYFGKSSLSTNAEFWIVPVKKK